MKFFINTSEKRSETKNHAKTRNRSAYTAIKYGKWVEGWWKMKWGMEAEEKEEEEVEASTNGDRLCEIIMTSDTNNSSNLNRRYGTNLYPWDRHTISMRSVQCFTSLMGLKLYNWQMRKLSQFKSNRMFVSWTWKLP